MYRFSRKERHFLEVQRVGRWAQVGTDGLPHATPLCYAFSKGVIYIGTERDSWKVQNLRAGTWVAFVVDEYTEEWDSLRGIRLWATAEVLRQGPEYQAAKRLLFRKYPQWRRLGWTDGETVVLKLTPQRATAWGV